MDMNASWAVTYTDGTQLYQYDDQAPQFDAAGGEVPLRAIDWTRVASVTFISQWAQDTFAFSGVPDGAQVRLMMRVRRGLIGSALVFLLVCTDADASVVPDPAQVRWVRYWFADGVVHDCPHFNCGLVGDRLMKLLKGELSPILPTHDAA